MNSPSTELIAIIVSFIGTLITLAIAFWKFGRWFGGLEEAVKQLTDVWQSWAKRQEEQEEDISRLYERTSVNTNAIKQNVKDIGSLNSRAESHERRLDKIDERIAAFRKES